MYIKNMFSKITITRHPEGHVSWLLSQIDVVFASRIDLDRSQGCRSSILLVNHKFIKEKYPDYIILYYYYILLCLIILYYVRVFHRHCFQRGPYRGPMGALWAPMGPMGPWPHGPHGPYGPHGPMGPMGPMGPWAPIVCYIIL